MTATQVESKAMARWGKKATEAHTTGAGRRSRGAAPLSAEDRNTIML